jgi:hypothetical protein
MAGCIFGHKEFNEHHFDATFPPKHAAQHCAIAGTNAVSDIKLKRDNAQPIDPLHWNDFWWKYNTSCNPFIGVKELMDRIMRTNYSRDQGCEDGLKRKELDAQGMQQKVEKRKLEQEQKKQQQCTWSKPMLPPTLQRVSVPPSKRASPGVKRGVQIKCYAVELTAPQQTAESASLKSAPSPTRGRSVEPQAEVPALPAGTAVAVA